MIGPGRNRMSRPDGHGWALQRGRLSLARALNKPFGGRWLVGLIHNGPKRSRGPFQLSATGEHPANGRLSTEVATRAEWWSYPAESLSRHRSSSWAGR